MDLAQATLGIYVKRNVFFYGWQRFQVALFSTALHKYSPYVMGGNPPS